MTIKLLTFNCWGLKYVSLHREARLRAIAEEIAVGEHDVVALQEVWVEGDWHQIEALTRAEYPYRRYFKSGIIAGPGLAVLSKFPIHESFLYRFPINGRPSAVARGDWFVGKSIGVCIIQGPQGRPMAVLNSHMHAPYGKTGVSAYATHRAVQAWDLSNLLKTLRKAGYAVVQVGDLNSRPGSLPYRLFTEHGGVQDSWDVLHNYSGPSLDDVALMDPEKQIAEGGVTCDSRLNTWRASREPWEACRLDYALIDPGTVKPVSASVAFTDLMPAPYSCSYLDHFAYSVELLIEDLKHEVKPGDLRLLYEETIAEIDLCLNTTIPAQRGWRVVHVYGSIVLIVAIHVGITWAASRQPWSAVLLSLLSSVLAVGAVVNAMITFMGLRAETRALEEIRMQVADALASQES